jgi:hypothetical protein
MCETIFRPLSGRGKPIKANRVKGGWALLWGDFPFMVTDSLQAEVLSEFFVDPNRWYPLGASMTEPPPNGLGSFLKRKHPSLSPRCASLIAALMVNEGLLEFRGAKPIELRRKTDPVAG